MKITRMPDGLIIEREASDGMRSNVTAKALMEESLLHLNQAELELRLSRICGAAGRTTWEREHDQQYEAELAKSKALSRWAMLLDRGVRERRLCPNGGGVAQKRSGVTVAGNIASGYGAVFFNPQVAGTEYKLAPDMVERIDRHAFDNALKRKDDAACLFNHNPDNIVGRVSNGTMKLSVDSRGLKYTVDLPSSPMGENVKAAIRRGDVSGSSFQFIPTKQRFVRGTGSSPDVREILDVTLFDCSPVVFPAYQATSSY
jgi:HK97 family phage prohead protease